MKEILQFNGENRFLSNFWPVDIRWEGLVYPSVENAFQAMKKLKGSRESFQHCWPGQAKKMGGVLFGNMSAEEKSSWLEGRVELMRRLLEVKFQDRNLRKKLLATGTARLVEGNWWHDTFWGVSGGVGENWLGRLLMERRKELKKCGCGTKKQRRTGRS